MLRIFSRLRQGPLAVNSSILFFSEGTSSVLMMATGFLVARLLTVTDFGKFTSALAFASIIAVLVDSGMGMVAAKDIARGGRVDKEHLNQLFSWRLCVITIACVATPIAAWALLPGGEARWVALGLTPGVLLVGMTDFFCWIFKGAQKVLWCAGLQITSRVLLLIFSLVALMRPQPMRSLLMAYAISGISMTGIGVFVLGHSMHALRWVPLPKEFFQKILPGIYSMGAILILSVIFTRVDLMLVARFRGDAEAGLFGAAGRIIDAFRLIPMVVYSVYLPVFSAAHRQPEQLRSQFKIAHDFLLLLSISIAVFGCAFAWPLFTHLLGPQYQGAASCFKPLVWSCVLMFSNILMFSLLYALNDHHIGLMGITGALTLEIVLDLILVPRFGMMAAAWARLAAETLNCSTLAWGLSHNGVLASSTSFFARSLSVIAVAAILLTVLNGQSMYFQFGLTWIISMTLAWMLGLGRIPKTVPA